jgi:tRNA threonylcarbamoyl adenosine modification protein (Sua5/YciO/YrdC/YwlC family)
MDTPITTCRLTEGDIPEAARLLKEGGLVALPTETVYGLAACATDGEAVEKIFDTKGRDSRKPLSVFVTDLTMAADYCRDIPALAHRLAKDFWPGPLTLILWGKGNLPPAVTSGGATLGLRCPDHPIALGVTRAAGVPLAAPSANPSGAPSPKTAAEVLAYFDGKIEGVMDGGPCAVGRESTIVDLTQDPPKILREGGIPTAVLEAYWKE